MGDSDYIKDVVQKIGGTIQFGRVFMKPGYVPIHCILSTPLF